VYETNRVEILGRDGIILFRNEGEVSKVEEPHLPIVPLKQSHDSHHEIRLNVVPARLIELTGITIGTRSSISRHEFNRVPYVLFRYRLV
jgi:hypothetical protein